MPSSDYNKYLAAIKAANDMENKELLRQIKNELIANYGLMDDDVDYLLSIRDDITRYEQAHA